MSVITSLIGVCWFTTPVILHSLSMGHILNPEFIGPWSTVSDAGCNCECSVSTLEGAVCTRQTTTIFKQSLQLLRVTVDVYHPRVHKFRLAVVDGYLVNKPFGLDHEFGKFTGCEG